MGNLYEKILGGGQMKIKSISIGWGEGAEWFIVGQDNWNRGWIVGKIGRLIDSNYYVEDDKGKRRVEIWELPHRLEYCEEVE